MNCEMSHFLFEFEVCQSRISIDRNRPDPQMNNHEQKPMRATANVTHNVVRLLRITVISMMSAIVLLILSNWSIPSNITATISAINAFQCQAVVPTASKRHGQYNFTKNLFIRFHWVEGY